MALYRVDEIKGSNETLAAPRLIEAGSQAEALRHCARDSFKIEAIFNPADAVRLAGEFGIEIETAGADNVVDVDGKPDRPTRQKASK